MTVIFAALGAAVVNAPFEGAMLLFLFSLSNVLQAFAIDRTRRAIKSLMKLRPEKALARRAINAKPPWNGCSAAPVVRVPSGNITSWPPARRSATAWRTIVRAQSLRM